MIITRKIELFITSTSPEERVSAWKFLRQLSHEVFKAYNVVTSHQYFNEVFTERIRKTDPEIAHKSAKLETKILDINKEIKRCKDKDEKKKLTDARKKLYASQNLLDKEARIKAEQLYLTSEENSTYQLISKQFPDIPSAIRATLNRDAVQGYRNDKFDVRMGKKSIRTYRSEMPIPFDKNSMRFFINDKKEIGMHWLNNVTFMLNFGRDKSNNREIVQRAIDGTYKYSNSKIHIKDNKIFLLFCVDIPEQKTELNEKLAVGVNLGIVVPAYCALSQGNERLAIGNINDLFRTRIQMQERRKRLSSQLRMARGGHGRTDKLKALESLSEKERNFVRTYNHMVSSQIVKFALKHNAKTIKMELLEGYGEKEKDSLILRNWSYFELHSMVEYKAKKFSMDVQYTDPYRNSHICNVCKVYHEDNLETRDSFKCKNKECANFNEHVFSDYNAALNNAMSTRIVTKKEDCQFHKNKTETA